MVAVFVIFISRISKTTIFNLQSKIPLTSLEVYTSDQYRIKLSSTGWKYKLPDWSRYLISRTGWKYKLPTSPRFYISKYPVLVGSINFHPVQGFVFQKYPVLVGSLYFQPVPDIFRTQNLGLAESFSTYKI